MLIFWLAFLLIFLVGLLLGVISLAPWVPTKKKDFKRIADLADIKSGQKFIDLGCGSGGLIFYLAKKYPDTQFIGIELAWPLWLVVYIRSQVLRAKNVKIVYGNLFKYPIDQYDKIFVFGLHKQAIQKLAIKFSRELKNSAQVISYTFSLPNLQLVEKSKPGNKDLSIYLYSKRV